MMTRLKRILLLLASLRLTVFTLTAALVLVFAGTMAQVKFGLYAVQEQYFQSWFIWWSPESGDWKMPVYPGGHLIGAILLINLIASLLTRHIWSWKKFGIQLIHVGIIIMLVGGLATDLFSVSSYMRIREGETKDYSEDDMKDELALINLTDPNKEAVTVIPDDHLEDGELIQHGSLPFKIKVLNRYSNSSLEMIGHGHGGSAKPPATQGIGARLTVKPLPPASRMDDRDVLSVVFELISNDGQSMGTWLVSRGLSAAQQVKVGDQTWSLQIRPARYYKPYRLTLLDFTHETYPGTRIPKDFSSTVMLDDDINKEHRQVRIYMNNPLRYAGETYYQSGFQEDNRGTVLQVVRNPSYQAPYIACVIISFGLMYQFTFHLLGFTRRTRKAAQS